VHWFKIRKENTTKMAEEEFIQREPRQASKDGNGSGSGLKKFQTEPFLSLDAR